MMKIKLGRLLPTLALVLSSCTGIYSWEEICSSSNPVFTELHNNQLNWTAHFLETEYTGDLANPFVIEIGVDRYVVRSLYHTDLGEPIISISINEGFPNTQLGILGIVYIPNERITDFAYDDYEVVLIESDIYCYRLIADSN
jgi:hypothetical protein